MFTFKRGNPKNDFKHQSFGSIQKTWHTAAPWSSFGNVEFYSLIDGFCTFLRQNLGQGNNMQRNCPTLADGYWPRLEANAHQHELKMFQWKWNQSIKKIWPWIWTGVLWWVRGWASFHSPEASIKPEVQAKSAEEIKEADFCLIFLSEICESTGGFELSLYQVQMSCFVISERFSSERSINSSLLPSSASNERRTTAIQIGSQGWRVLHPFPTWASILVWTPWEDSRLWSVWSLVLQMMYQCMFVQQRRSHQR